MSPCRTLPHCGAGVFHAGTRALAQRGEDDRERAGHDAERGLVLALP